MTAVNGCAVTTDEWATALRLLAARDHDPHRTHHTLEIALAQVCGTEERATAVLDMIQQWRTTPDPIGALIEGPKNATGSAPVGQSSRRRAYAPAAYDTDAGPVGRRPAPISNRCTVSPGVQSAAPAPLPRSVERPVTVAPPSPRGDRHDLAVLLAGTLLTFTIDLGIWRYVR